MDLQQQLFNAQPPLQATQLSVWGRSRRACLYVGTASLSCLLTQLARTMPPIAPVIGIAMGASAIALLAWAALTPGDQRLSITLAGLAKLSGIALGAWDAAEILQLVGLKHWVAIGVIGIIGAFVFLSEGRSNGRKD